MKHLVITILMAVSASLTASAQTFKEFFDEVITGDISSFNFLKPDNKLLNIGNSEAVKAYAKEQMASDIAELIRPYYEATMSSDDMKELYEAFKQPKMKQAREHIQASMAGNFSEELAQELTGSAMSFVMGKTPDDIELKQGISKKYAKLCKEYCEVSGATNMIDAMLQSVPTGNASGMLNNIVGYLKSNMPTILANKFYGNVSTDDLKALQKLSKTEAYKHFSEGTTKFMGNIVPFAKELQGRMKAWEEKNK
ncbi:MAG: hypothetical protein MJZ08_08815 [Bacteroidaceae bacterium]|nr:hypothetical protein [Bacteroidaceae bacterium]